MPSKATPLTALSPPTCTLRVAAAACAVDGTKDIETAVAAASAPLAHRLAFTDSPFGHGSPVGRSDPHAAGVLRANAATSTKRRLTTGSSSVKRARGTDGSVTTRSSVRPRPHSPERRHHSPDTAESGSRRTPSAADDRLRRSPAAPIRTRNKRRAQPSSARAAARPTDALRVRGLGHRGSLVAHPPLRANRAVKSNRELCTRESLNSPCTQSNGGSAPMPQRRCRHTSRVVPMPETATAAALALLTDQIEISIILLIV